MILTGIQENPIEKSVAEWLKENPQTRLDITNGQNCAFEGECDV